MKQKRRGSLESAHEIMATPSTRQPRRKKGEELTVAMTIRLNRETWNELHQMALSDRLSINELILKALNREREARGLPPLKAALTKAELKALEEA